MRRGIAITILSGLIFFTACNDPAADTTKATTGEAAKVASPAPAQGQKYVITPQNSKIEFVGSKVTGKHNGSFGDFSGQVDYAGAPENSRVSITIKSDPEANFVSTTIKPGGENGATHTVTGNLTLHGVTKAITFPATINVTPDVATVDSSFSINRKDFGINYAGAADNLIRDDVVLTLHVRATK
jgi:polyisoprenoid-binding protein YceI